jgi:transposase
MPQQVLPLFPAEARPITDVLSVSRDTKTETVWYFHGAMPVFNHAQSDVKSFRMYTSQLVVNGQCKQMDIVRTFGVTKTSVKRSVKRLREGGPQAFFEKRGVRGKSVWKPERLNRAQALLDEGRTRKEVVEALGVKADTLYRAIKAGQLRESKKSMQRHEANGA